jgi:hypothetical protein
MAELKDAIEIILVMIAVAGGLWAHLHLLAFLKARGIHLVALMPAKSLRRWKFKPVRVGWGNKQ